MSKEYIDREEAIKILEHYDLSSGSILGYHSGAIECAISAIEMLPAADVAPVVHGRWKRIRSNWYCTRCRTGYRITYGAASAKTFTFCPNCGAKMDEEAPKEDA